MPLLGFIPFLGTFLSSQELFKMSFTLSTKWEAIHSASQVGCRALFILVPRTSPVLFQEFPREEILCAPAACHGARLISSGCASVGMISLERITAYRIV